MKKLLICGGTGFIGSYLYKQLIQKYDVISVDLELYGNPGITNIKKDFNDLTKEFIQRFDIVILLAGNSSVRNSENIVYTFNNNVRNFINLIQKINKNQKFIYASSSSIYSSLDSGIKEESSNQYCATNYYDFSKYEIDSYAKMYGELNDLEWYGLRFGTVNGWSPNLRDEIMINCMWNNSITKKEININNIGIYRPILGISDLLNSVLAIIEKGTFQKRGIYNLASFNSTVLEIGQTVCDLLNRHFDSISRNSGQIRNSIKLNISDSNTKCYDFQISTKKFTNNFGFIFKENIKSILSSLMSDKIILKSDRNKVIEYV